MYVVCMCVYIYVCVCVFIYMGFHMTQWVKNLLAMQETQGSIPGLGRSHRGGNDNTLSIPSQKIPWTEERLQFKGLQRVAHN